ncbi:hypothetical protein KR018_005816 [Drosophila ironensis]|nr:hypothetical protein KR018_005816 [Drosophila ironensis]
MAPHASLSRKQLIGRIQSVYCKDFVSYSEITFYPKHYLNVLTGPNGSGKSTIVSAIILALGGEPQLLDRSSSVADYIQSGKTAATVIVRIYGRAANSTESFRRIINSNGSSAYAINGENTTKKNFLAAVASYNIQVSNLCQFLPQDRVQDFSKMNPQQLLLNTMTSVCDEQLTNDFNTLKEMRANQVTISSDSAKVKIDLKKKEKRLEQMQQSVEQFKEREEVQQKLTVLNAKKLWAEAQEGGEKVMDMKKRVNEAKIRSDKCTEEYISSARAQEQMQKARETLKGDIGKKTKQLEKAISQKRSLEGSIDGIKQEIREKNIVLQQNIQKTVRSAAEAEDLKQLVVNKSAELQGFNDTKAAIFSELEAISLKLTSARLDAINQYNHRKVLENTLNGEKIPEVEGYRHKMQRLENVKNQKIEAMKQRNPNLIRAMEWVSQNKDQFKATIYDPMLFELSMQSNDAAKYLENVVKQRDLLAFACEDKQDMSDLTNELCVKQKLGVNIIYCDPAQRCIYGPSISLQELRPLGFHAYLLDLVSGPYAILNKLCASYGIHNIPIGSDAVSNHTSSIPKNIRVYFGGDKRFTVTTSRYRSDVIITETTIQGKNQLIAVDTQQLAKVRQLCSDATKQCDKLRNAITAADNEFERFQGIARERFEKKSKLEHKIKHFNSLQSEIEVLKKKLEELKNTDALDMLKSNFYEFVYQGMEKIVEIRKKMGSCLKTIHICMVEKKLAETKLSVFTIQNNCDDELLQELHNKRDEAKREHSKLSEALDRAVADVSKRKAEVKRICEGELPTSENFPYKQEFMDMQEMQLDAVREAIHDHQARLECMKSVNSEVVKSFRELENEIKSLMESIQSGSSREKTMEAEMSNLYDKWEPKLTSLVETISAKFSEFMESIEYVGEVVLSMDDKFDFESYGIQIMVQFRKGALLQPLDKFIQSGGERAVSIAIYSLSLQHVTHVPFRCVDEINQGMDAKNERHIFDLLLREATKHGSAQYLFVTPKLLRDLNYNEHLSVSIVHNSKTVLPGTTFAS